ncbi:superinfection immunity protein [Pseudomonas asiatica]|nr:superinfection immunity protein [Pseudomonas asiatica]
MVLDAGSLQSNVMKVMLVALYFLPMIIAWSRGHHNKAPIFLLNLFLGWTGLGWLAALIWSVSSIKRSGKIHREPAPDTREKPGDPYAALEKLADLRDRGHITADEFEAEKAKVLGR